MTDVNIITYGQSAIVTAKIEVESVSEGQNEIRRFQVTHLWIFDGEWKRAAFHDGRIS